MTRFLLAVLLVIPLALPAGAQTYPSSAVDQQGNPLPVSVFGSDAQYRPQSLLEGGPVTLFGHAFTDPNIGGRAWQTATFVGGTLATLAIPIPIRGNLIHAVSAHDTVNTQLRLWGSTDGGATFLPLHVLGTLVAGTNLPQVAEYGPDGSLFVGVNCGGSVVPACEGIYRFRATGGAQLAFSLPAALAGATVRIADIATSGNTLLFTVLNSAANTRYTCRSVNTPNTETYSAPTCALAAGGSAIYGPGMLAPLGFDPITRQTRWGRIVADNATFEISNDDGLTWQTGFAGVAGETRVQIVSQRQFGRKTGRVYVMYATALVRGYYFSDDGGATWGQSRSPWAAGTDGNLLDLGGGNMFYVPRSAANGMYQSYNDGKTWSRVLAARPANTDVGLLGRAMSIDNLIFYTNNFTATQRLAVSRPAGWGSSLGSVSIGAPATASCKTTTVNGLGVAGADVTIDATAGGIATLDANPARCGALIRNTGAADMRCAPTGLTPTATAGLLIPPGMTLLLGNEGQQAWRCIRTTATSTAASTAEERP